MADASKNTPSPPNDRADQESPLSTQPSVPPAVDLRAPTSVLNVFCPQCGYNLRGIDSARCPECAYSLDFRRLTEPQLPWLQRSEIGSVRAYWRTVRTAIVRKKTFWEELSRPVSYRDAQLFRWITVLLAYLPLVLLILALMLSGVNADISTALRRNPFLFISVTVALLVCLLLFMAGATGLPSYFFHPKRLPVEQQNRAVALSYYCCAPLAWLSVVYMLVAVVLLGDWFNFFNPNNIIHTGIIMACVVLAVYLCCRIALEWPMALCSLHKCATQSPSKRYGLFFLLLPLLWAVLGCIVFIGVPLAVGIVVLVVASLW